MRVTRQGLKKLHRPATIETFTGRKENVTDEEIEMVAEAFKAQVKQLLLAMVRIGSYARNERDASASPLD